MDKALKGIKVVDLTQHLAGPFCTMLLADMGAEVVKVEPPWGDATRSRSSYPEIKGQTSYFMFVNRNKKSLVLDLKSEGGLRVLKRLVEKSDVVVENFRPGVMDRLGIGYEALKEVNPSLVYASISGFGQDGPYVKRPSFDIVAQAMSGWMWLNSREARGPNSGPSLVPSCLAGSPGDTIPGTFCALSILAALHHKNKTGRGQRIDVAQTDSLMTMTGLSLTRYLVSGVTADERSGRESETIHGVYEAQDGYIVVRALGEKAMGVLAETVGVEVESLKPSSEELVDWFKERDRAEILDLLAEKIPCASVLTEDEVVVDPNVEAREMIVEKPHPLGFTYKALSTGIKFSETPVSIDLHPPLLGENTEEILLGLGYDEKEMAQLVKEKAIAKAGD